MKKSRLLSGFLALALCATLFCVPVSAEETTERQPGAPVLTWGTVTRTEAGKNESFMLEQTKDGQKEQTILHIADTTLCLDAVSGMPTKLDDVKDGSTAYVYTSPVMLTSYPPQTSAVLMLVNIPADFAVPAYYTVLTAEAAQGSTKVTTDQGKTLTIPDTASFFPYLTRNIVTKAELVPGARILVWNDTAGKPNKVMVFPYAVTSLFTDVAADSAYYDGINFVTRNGFMDGATDTTFAPNEGMTRANVALSLWRVAGAPAPKSTTGFSDVKADAVYTSAVYWAKENGLVQGFSDGTFAPDRTITREQMAVILYRYEQLKGGGFEGQWMFLLDFTDRNQISQSAYEGVAWCVMNKVLTGRSDGTLSPKSTVTRAQAATMLMRYLGVQSAGESTETAASK